MYLLIITILSICVIALIYHFQKEIQTQREIEERAAMHFKRAERYFKDTQKIQQIRKIINSDLLSFEKIDLIKELVDNLQTEN